VSPEAEAEYRALLDQAAREAEQDAWEARARRLSPRTFALRAEVRTATARSYDIQNSMALFTAWNAIAAALREVISAGEEVSLAEEWMVRDAAGLPIWWRWAEVA
jgi:hypothetical protein